jgi:hypothetical protein
MTCAYPGCGEKSIASCECCEAATPFCAEHGSAGRDEPRFRDLADPAHCWKCGGFNADA